MQQSQKHYALTCSYPYFVSQEIAHISRDHKYGITNRIKRTEDEYMVQSPFLARNLIHSLTLLVKVSAEPGTDSAFVISCAIIIDHIITSKHHGRGHHH